MVIHLEVVFIAQPFIPSLGRSCTRLWRNWFCSMCDTAVWGRWLCVLLNSYFIWRRTVATTFDFWWIPEIVQWLCKRYVRDDFFLFNQVARTKKLLGRVWPMILTVSAPDGGTLAASAGAGAGVGVSELPAMLPAIICWSDGGYWMNGEIDILLFTL